MDNRGLLYLLLGSGVLFLIAIVMGINPSISLPVPFTVDYLMFMGGQIVNDAINAAISGILSLPWWVLVTAIGFLVLLGAGYSSDSDTDSGIVSVPDTDSSSSDSDPDWVAKGAQSVAIGLNKAAEGVAAIGHGTAIVLSKVGKQIKESKIISIDFALAQITGLSVTVAGFVGQIFENDSGED